jgi:ABC-type multidrug transport system fused ATPase/permease subunit
VNTNTEINKISSLSILKKIIFHLNTKRKKQLTLVFILSFFSSLAESISIALLLPFISFFISPETYLFNNFFSDIFEFFNITEDKNILSFVTFLFISIILLGGLIKIQYTKKSNQLTDKIASDFRVKIFNFFIIQDFSYFFKQSTNEIMSNLLQKTGAFSTIIFSSLNILNAILIATGIVIVLIINEPFYTPIIISTIIFFFYIIFKIKAKSVFKKGQTVNLNQNYLINIFDNAVGYLQEIIVYDLRYFFSRVLSKISKDTAKSSSKIKTISATPRIYLETFVIVFVVIIIYFSNFLERPMETNIAYLAILAYGAQKCLPLINQIYNYSINFRSQVPTAIEFLNILGEKKISFPTNEDLNFLDFKERIQLENLYFKYEEDLPHVLKDINVDIRAGDKVLIKGKTGTGKSTLINILSGLLVPTKGKFIIDNKEVNSINIRNWQKNIAIVPQSIFLNDASILENIAIGVSEDKVDYKKIKESSKISCIADFIESLPNKYNEKVGEKGIRLSGGQKQRIGIARAIYRGAKVLILDEPTNALDLKTEELVIESLSKFNKEMTIIMISHSSNSIKSFNKLINLDEL